MTSKADIFVILFKDKDTGVIASNILNKILDNASRDTYHLEACGNIWIAKVSGWTLEKLRESIQNKIKDIKDIEGDKFDPAFVVFEVKDKVSGYYYESLWDWLRAGDKND
ncbi:hypothetical protein IMCC14465_12620 [alpha proteobacterium IMCC14465]|uniref:Uncharacterized protein n=1 Tax=alpha proteobacterium IMCC14465 TaxID=1220535 RepID=J9DHT1_9PROT|nr:hypothetical protein IMCC14465_12620 [alpha proteobacterium IMCC14465]